MLREYFFDPERRRLRAAWRIIIGYFFLMLVIGVLASLVDAIEVPFIEAFLWQLLAAPILIAVAWLLARKVDRRAFREYGLTWRPAQLALGTGLGIIMVAVIFGVEMSLGWVSIGDRMHTRYDVPFAVGWMGFFLRYTSVAVFEELFHRGFLITNLGEAMGGTRSRSLIAAVLGALLFGALHLTNQSATAMAALNISLLALVFGVAYLWTGGLSLAIGMHFGWNFALGPVFGLPVSGYEPRVSLLLSETCGSPLWTGADFGPEGGLLTTCALLVTLFLFAAFRPFGKIGGRGSSQAVSR